MSGTIIVGYVPTPEGEAALDYAIYEAKAHNAEIVIVNASRGDTFIDPYKAEPSSLEQISDRLDDLNIVNQISSPKDGVDAADHILTVSERYHDSLIVLGLRRRSKVGKLLLGSTAQTILSDATRPVLTVRATD